MHNIVYKWFGAYYLYSPERGSLGVIYFTGDIMETQRDWGISKAVEIINEEAKTGARIPQPTADFLFHWTMLSNITLARILSLENILSFPTPFTNMKRKYRSVEWQGHPT